MPVFKTLGNYLAYYFLTAAVYGILSWLVDLGFVYWKNGSIHSYRGGPPHYFLWFVMGFVFVTHFAVASYYFLVKVLKISKLPERLAAMTVFAILIAFMIGDYGPSYYIGPYETLRLFILYPLIGWAVELIRFGYLKKRDRADTGSDTEGNYS